MVICQHCEVLIPNDDEPAVYLGPGRGMLCARCAAEHLGEDYDPEQIFEDEDLERLIDRANDPE